jgi:hypothetical protein
MADPIAHTPPQVTVSLNRPLAAAGTVNQPIKLDPFPLEDLSNVDSSNGVNDGDMLVYDGDTGRWKVQPIEVPAPVVPDSTINIAADIGVGSVGPGQMLSIVGENGVQTTLVGRTITVTADPGVIDGGTFG